MLIQHPIKVVEPNERQNEVPNVCSLRLWYGKLIQVAAAISDILIQVVEKLNNIFMLCLRGDGSQTLEEFHQSIKNATLESESKIAEYKSKLHTFDTFINTHPEIKRIFNNALQLYGQFISKININEYKSNGNDGVIEKWGKTKRHEIDLKHVWKERIRFVKSHLAVSSCMEKQVRKIMKKPVHSEFEQRVLGLISEFLEEPPQASAVNINIHIDGEPNGTSTK